MEISEVFSLGFFLEWWFLILIGIYMVVGYGINREEMSSTSNVSNYYDNIDNLSDVQFSRKDAHFSEIKNLRQLKYIQFWLACCSFTLMGILVTLLDKQ